VNNCFVYNGYIYYLSEKRPLFRSACLLLERTRTSMGYIHLCVLLFLFFLSVSSWNDLYLAGHIYHSFLSSMRIIEILILTYCAVRKDDVLYYLIRLTEFECKGCTQIVNLLSLSLSLYVAWTDDNV
jgi:hypothetical protein